MLLFFLEPRPAPPTQPDGATEATSETASIESTAGVDLVTETGEKMPTDKLLDVSPLALRMSSPFNAGYWLAAA